MKRIYINIIVILIATGSLAQSNDRNYVHIRTMLNAAGTIYIDSIQYFDGLGQLTQNVLREITPGKADLVTLQEYDKMGRESKKWIATPFAGNGGKYVTDFTTQAITYHNDSYPYEENIYEPSKSSKISFQIGCGKYWREDGKKGISTEYLTNDLSDNCLKVSIFTINSNGLLRKGYLYNTGELHCTKVIDEDGNLTYTFKNKLDQIILNRQMVENTPHDTYYVYDDYENLVYVIPPILVDRLMINTSYFPYAEDSPLYLYGYYNKYDNRNRCIEKKLPGCLPIYFVYDKTDRLVFSQDGNQRQKGIWSFKLYDNFGRETILGTCKNTNTSFAKNIVVTTTFQNSRSGIEQTGYKSNFNIVNPEILIVNYYDNYDFLTLLNRNYLNYSVMNGYGTRYVNTESEKNSAKGLLTGIITKTIGYTNSDMMTALYYDEQKNIIQKKMINHANGFDHYYYNFLFAGKIQSCRHDHFIPGKMRYIEQFRYLYDHALRLIETKYSINQRSYSTLSQNSYDEVGHLKQKTIPLIGETITYNYNIRDWLTNISGNFFNETVDYAPYYAGNIGQMKWKTIQDTKERVYNFTYDGLNRITEAFYFECTPLNCTPNYYSVKIDEYDKQGNIKHLIRNGLATKMGPILTPRLVGGTDTYGAIDNLTLNYRGNQLVSVTDNAPYDPVYKGTMHFIDGTDEEVEYSYDVNGNMIADKNKGIETIEYNFLNLPQKVSFDKIYRNPSGGRYPFSQKFIDYTYSATGIKLGVNYGTNIGTVISPISGEVNSVASQANSYIRYYDNFIYENDTLSKILFPEGYFSCEDNYFVFHSYIKDHSGNVRVVVRIGGEVTQINHYYPFGGLLGCSIDGSAQRYRYNSKELDRMNGLDLYNFGARQQDPILGRFITIDPLCEKYYSVSPYVYCMNNPVRYIDPDGKKIVIGTFWQRFLGMLGLDSYVFKVQKQLEQNNKDSQRILSVYNQLESSDFVYRILPLSESPVEGALEEGNHVVPNSLIERGKKQGATLFYDPDMQITPRYGRKRVPRIGLAHEFGHLEDFMKGRVIPVDQEKKGKGDKIELYKIELNEVNSLELENIIKGILNYENRDEYFMHEKKTITDEKNEYPRR